MIDDSEIERRAREEVESTMGVGSWSTVTEDMREGMRALFRRRAAAAEAAASGAAPPPACPHCGNPLLEVLTSSPPKCSRCRKAVDLFDGRPVRVTIQRLEVAAEDPDRFAFGLVEWARTQAKPPESALPPIADPRCAPGHMMSMTPGQVMLVDVARRMATDLMRASGKRATAIHLGRREWRALDCTEGMVVDGMAVKLIPVVESMIGVSA